MEAMTQVRRLGPRLPVYRPRPEPLATQAPPPPPEPACGPPAPGDQAANLDATAVASKIGMSVTFVYAEVARGRIAYEKRGRVYRFTEAAVEAWFSANRHPAGEAARG